MGADVSDGSNHLTFILFIFLFWAIKPFLLLYRSIFKYNLCHKKDVGGGRDIFSSYLTDYFGIKTFM